MWRSAAHEARGHAGAALERKVLEIARSYSVRILGPNSLGIMRPPTRLNATFTQERAHEGNMALVSQSGAICSAILDWALPNNVGFSSVVSLGRSSDIDFGEILDYLESWFNGRWYEPPINLDGLARSTRASVYLQSGLIVSRTHPAATNDGWTGY